MKYKLKDALSNGIIGIFAIVFIILILAICVAFEGAIIYWVGNFALDVFNVDYQLTYIQGVAAGLILWVVGSFFKSSGSKKD